MSDIDLTVVITDAAGNTKTLDANASDPGDRPEGIQFGTQRASGFYTCSLNLARLIDRDNIDISLGNDIKIIGASGDSAWEGYVSALPRSLDTAHTLGITGSGWMGHAADEPFVFGIIDRDLSKWAGASNARRIAIAGSFDHIEDPNLAPDAGGLPSVKTTFSGAWQGIGGLPDAEAWYDTGGGWMIGRLVCDWNPSATVNTADASWVWEVTLTNDDQGLSGDSTGNLRAPGIGHVDLSSSSNTRRYAYLTHQYIAGPAGTDGTDRTIDWYNLAVYGYNGPPLIANNIGGLAPLGVAASEAIKWIAQQYAPLLDTSGVQDTTYPIAHLVFDSPTTPYDAFLLINNFHQWEIGVFENRVLTFAAVDLTDWDWEIRHDEVGNQIGLQGDSFENVRNGIIVQYTDLATGYSEFLHPEDHPELRDDSIDNPANQAGRRMYSDPFEIPFPCTQADALQLGSVKLAEATQASAPGSFTIQGRIRDRQGNMQPVWKVRSGDRIRLTSSANLSDRPRLIHETSYDHNGFVNTISVDSTLKYVDGYIDRLTTALLAAGLSS